MGQHVVEDKEGDRGRARARAAACAALCRPPPPCVSRTAEEHAVLRLDQAGQAMQVGIHHSEMLMHGSGESL